MNIPDALLLDGTAVDPNTTLFDTVLINGVPTNRTYYWKDRMAFYRPDISYVAADTAQALSGKGYNNAFGTWSLRVGARFSF
jgi:hypothetical protein